MSLARSDSNFAGPRWRARVSRIWRWEFWPTWLFYLPVMPWIALLALRHRGLTTLTAANPAIPHGGVVGESKHEILSRLPSEWVVPSALILPGEVDGRIGELSRIMKDREWEFPIILKPDAGERGAGLKLVRDQSEASAYFRGNFKPIIAQVYHPGPFEAGIFYFRLPGEDRGRIFSITDKHFPFVAGDGRSTVIELIWQDSRLRMQADRFLARLNGQAEVVLAPGERLRLAIAGNHCQGTMFSDGSHLITPQLESAIDAIAKQFEGFYFGRFDVRYADVGAFREGRGFSILELNGATSESTNIYDPSWSIAKAYAVLFRQWSILFRIGQANRARGSRTTPLRQLMREIRSYYRDRCVGLVAD